MRMIECGTLKHSHWINKSPIIIGQSFPNDIIIKKNNTTTILNETIWNGFAKIEHVKSWFRNGWIPVELHIDRFTEGNENFEVPQGHIIQAILLEKKSNYLNIVTRPAETKKEKQIHHRWPLITPVNFF